MTPTHVVTDEWLYVVRTDREKGRCSVECQNPGWGDRKFAHALARAIEAWMTLRLENESMERRAPRGPGLVREPAPRDSVAETNGREAPAAPPAAEPMTGAESAQAGGLDSPSERRHGGALPRQEDA